MNLSKRHTLQRLRNAALISLGASALLASPAQAAEPLPVVASFSILGDWVKVVGGERVKVTTLIGADADAHAFEPSPADAKTVLGARLLVLNGLHFEPWAQKLAKSANYQGATLMASEGIKPLAAPGRDAHGHDHKEAHDHGDVDPHAWQDPQQAMVYVKNIAKTLASLDPAGTESYKKNSSAYLSELQKLDAEASAAFAALPKSKRRAITGHRAFEYLGARYQIQFLAAQGVNTQSDPSAKQVAQLVRQIRQDKIRAVFLENNSNTKLIEQVAAETGVRSGARLYTGALSGPTGPAANYLQMMRYNLTQLVTGMKLND